MYSALIDSLSLEWYMTCSHFDIISKVFSDFGVSRKYTSNNFVKNEYNGEVHFGGEGAYKKTSTSHNIMIGSHISNYHYFYINIIIA